MTDNCRSRCRLLDSSKFWQYLSISDGKSSVLFSSQALKYSFFSFQVRRNYSLLCNNLSPDAVSQRHMSNSSEDIISYRNSYHLICSYFWRFVSTYSAEGYSVYFDMVQGTSIGRCPLRRGYPQGIPLLGHADLGTVPAEYFCSPCQRRVITIVKRSIRTSRDLWIWWIIFLPILFPACCLICCLKGFRQVIDEVIQKYVHVEFMYWKTRLLLPFLSDAKCSI